MQSIRFFHCLTYYMLFTPGWGLIMSFHIIIRIAEDPRRADQSTIIRITLSREVRQEAGRTGGARVVDEWMGGPSWSPNVHQPKKSPSNAVGGRAAGSGWEGLHGRPW